MDEPNPGSGSPIRRRAHLVSSVPPLLFERYASTIRRAPAQPLLDLPATLSELTGPGPALADITADDVDLTSNASADGVAIGERIIVTGRILDAHLRPVRRAVVEIWQANAAGRYAHEQDDHDAPLDPNFIGAGWCITGIETERAYAPSLVATNHMVGSGQEGTGRVWQCPMHAGLGTARKFRPPGIR